VHRVILSLANGRLSSVNGRSCGFPGDLTSNSKSGSRRHTTESARSPRRGRDVLHPQLAEPGYRALIIGCSNGLQAGTGRPAIRRAVKTVSSPPRRLGDYLVHHRDQDAWVRACTWSARTSPHRRRYGSLGERCPAFSRTTIAGPRVTTTRGTCGPAIPPRCLRSRTGRRPGSACPRGRSDAH